MSSHSLPAGFEALEPFVARWAIAGSANRAQARSDSTAEERQAFFDAARDLLTPAISYLDQKPLADFTDSEKRLMDLMLSYAHVALAVEIQGEAEPKHARFRQRMIITRSPADVS